MLLNLIPRMFKQPKDVSAAAFLDDIYDRKYNHGWCVQLNDDEFDEYYKMITGYTHVSINYNRAVLYEELCYQKPMLCFMDLFEHEIRSKNMNVLDIKLIETFIIENEFDSDSVMDDIIFESGNSLDQYSNIEVYLKLHNKYKQFIQIENTITAYAGAVEKHKIKTCNLQTILSLDKCSFVQFIINVLKQDHTETVNINVRDLLAAYDHLINVHKLCLNANDDENPSKIRTYMINKLNGHCISKNCEIVHKHINRKREYENANTEQNECDTDNVQEILCATLNSLHCYILHSQKELYRLNTNNKFITSVMSESFDEKKSDSMVNIDFGVCVLNWIDHTEKPAFNSFHDEMIRNPQSTLNEQAYINYQQECYIKMTTRKEEHFLLDEIISLKIYCDSNTFQSAFRKAFSKSSPKSAKKSFYHWGMKLYETSLYHGKPIQRCSTQSKTPHPLYHGLNGLFVLNEYSPKYNGPISVSFKKLVVHSVAGTNGLIWTIKPSYNNHFKRMAGIYVSWISQYKNEGCVLLMNQRLPIAAAHNFDDNSKNNVDHLLFTIKGYEKRILNPKKFFSILGIKFDRSWIKHIKTHNTLYDTIKADGNRRVINVLVEDLKLKQLSKEYIALTSKFKMKKVHQLFNYCSFVMDSPNDEYLNDCEYKIECSDMNDTILRFNDILLIHKNKITNNKKCKIFVKNEHLFCINEYILLQTIYIDDLQIHHWPRYLEKHLNENNALINLDVSSIPSQYHPDILNCQFALLCDSNNDTKQLQINLDEMRNCSSFIYRFNNIKDIHFVVPFTCKTTACVYVQLEKQYDFVLLKTFDLSDRIIHQNNKVDYILNVLRRLHQPIHNPKDLYSQMDCKLSDEEASLMAFSDMLYQPTSYNASIYVLHRVVNELKVSHNQLSKRYKVFTTSAKIEVYDSFLCFCVYVDVPPKQQQDFNSTTYQIIADENGFKPIEFRYNESIVIRDDSLINRSFKIAVKNPELFMTEHYFPLQNVEKALFKYCKRGLDFSNCLDQIGNKIILYCHEEDSEEFESVCSEYDGQTLGAKFALVCDGFGQPQINAAEIYANYSIYQFERIEDIHFIIPFTQKLNTVRIYVQLTPGLKFVCVKTFNVTMDKRKENRRNKIDHLLNVLKVSPFKIDNPQRFYDQIGITLIDHDVPIISKNKIIYEKSALNEMVKSQRKSTMKYFCILERLINELNIVQLSPLYKKYQNKMLGKSNFLDSLFFVWKTEDEIPAKSHKTSIEEITGGINVRIPSVMDIKTDQLARTPSTDQVATPVAVFTRSPRVNSYDEELKTDVFRKVSSLTEAQKQLLVIDVEPLFEIETLDERHKKLTYWLDCCALKFDFLSLCKKEKQAIETKRQMLSEILDYIDMSDYVHNDKKLLKSIMKMCKANLFRPLPLTIRMILNTPDYCLEDDSEIFEDPDFPHLVYIYEIVLAIIKNIKIDEKSRKKILGKSLIVPLTELFASEDKKEREFVKAILHAIYARNMRCRRVIRGAIVNCCYRVIYNENDNMENGLSECLQLLGGIILGLCTPIKQEYKNILYNCLIPLHKSNNRKLHKFHEALMACMLQFVLKDQTMSLHVLFALLKYWPVQSASKCELFLKEGVIIFNNMSFDDDENILFNSKEAKIVISKWIDKLIEFIISDNHILSQNALLALSEIGIQTIIDMNKEETWPKILNVLFDNRDNKRHWCSPLHEYFNNALQTFIDRDGQSVKRFETIYNKTKNNINQFKNGYFKNGYNPIYPNHKILFHHVKKHRMEKYKQIQIMANKNKYTHVEGNKPYKPSIKLPKPPKKKKKVFQKPT